MVQGRLLTTHPGGVHGGGEAPGGDPPLRQGAGKSSPGAPDLRSGGGGRTEMRSRKRVPVSRVSGHDINICQRGASDEARGAQARPGAAQGGRHQGAWGPGGPPPAVLRVPGSFWNADFLYNFSGIFLAVLVMGKPEIQKQPKTETGTGVH